MKSFISKTVGKTGHVAIDILLVLLLILTHAGLGGVLGLVIVHTFLDWAQDWWMLNWVRAKLHL